MGAHGIDTVCFRWRAPETIERLHAQRGHWRPRGRGWLWGRSICGGAVVVTGDYLSVEARLAVLIGDDRLGSPLTPVDRLPDAVTRVQRELSALRAAVPEEPLVTRLDLAAELIYDDGVDGLAFMSACSRALRLNRARPTITPDSAGRVESLTWATFKGRHEVARLYDAGRRHETHRAGERVRLEIQEQWSGGKVRTLEHVAATDLARLYERRLQQFTGAHKKINVDTPAVANREVHRRYRRGELDRKRARTLLGQIAKLEFPDLLDRHEQNRLAREVRAAGISLQLLGVVDAAPVDIAGPLTALVGAWELDG